MLRATAERFGGSFVELVRRGVALDRLERQPCLMFYRACCHEFTTLLDGADACLQSRDGAVSALTGSGLQTAMWVHRYVVFHSSFPSGRPECFVGGRSEER